MTAIQDWIDDLAGNKSSDGDQNLRSKVATAIAALQDIQASLPPGGVAAANKVYAGPVTGAAAAPNFRSLVANDVPNLQALNGTLTYPQLPAINYFKDNTAHNPVATSSATTVMMGLGASYAFTPKYTGVVMIIGSGWITTNTINQNGNAFGYYGQGAVPIYGAVPSGTQINNESILFTPTAAAGPAMPFSFCTIVDGLVHDGITPMWFDYGLSAAGGAAAAVKSKTFGLFELR